MGKLGRQRQKEVQRWGFIRHDGSLSWRHNPWKLPSWGGGVSTGWQLLTWPPVLHALCSLFPGGWHGPNNLLLINRTRSGWGVSLPWLGGDRWTLASCWQPLLLALSPAPCTACPDEAAAVLWDALQRGRVARGWGRPLATACKEPNPANGHVVSHTRVPDPQKLELLLFWAITFGDTFVGSNK